MYQFLLLWLCETGMMSCMRMYKTFAKCHPDRPHAAKGLCFACYCQQYPRATRAKCHPDRLAYIDGLCRSCYDRDLKKRNPKYAARQKENARRWVEIHFKRKADVDRAYHARPGYSDARAERARHRMLAKFGMTWEDELALHEYQGGKCAICGCERVDGKRYFDVDHSHVNGEVRGLLCGRCNKALGLLDDSVERVAKVLEYLNNPPARYVIKKR